MSLCLFIDFMLFFAHLCEKCVREKLVFYAKFA